MIPDESLGGDQDRRSGGADVGNGPAHPLCLTGPREGWEGDALQHEHGHAGIGEDARARDRQAEQAGVREAERDHRDDALDQYAQRHALSPEARS